VLAEIILPLPLAQTYTYVVGQEFASQIAVGKRVTVSFGAKKTYNGIVLRVFEGEAKENYKNISQIIDNEPVVTENQLKLWQIISEYYCAPIGDIYTAAVPSGLRLDTYREKTVKILVPNFDINDNEQANFVLEKLKKSKRQQETFLKILDCFFEKNNFEIEFSELQKKLNISQNILKTLIQKEIFLQNERVVSRLETKKSEQDAKILTENQKKTLSEIEKLFEEKSTVLLHGVTSSGKTEIYIHLIIKYLSQNKNVLFLVPEIGLTSQLMERLQKIFGETLLVYHSKMSDAQRVEMWNILLQNAGNKVVIGTRSSVFLPFRNLDLIVIDEEHDNSFFQSDASPHYSAKGAAGFLSRIFGAKILLGSATPSIESYSNAQFGKYGLTTLKNRFNDIQLPEIQLLDLKEMYFKKRMRGHFSLELIDKINETLGKGEQVILFQNRRGFSLSLECAECGWVQKCTRCDVSLTYHRLTNALSCHYCGYTVQNQRVCKNCGSRNITNKGFGTEQVQEEAEKLFPNFKIARLDSDSAKKRDSFSKILSTFERKEIDILVGTQMVSKGIDFSNVGLVAVLNADNLLNFPDFRSHENAFEMLVQISGRAGRKEKQGIVIIQTFEPNSPLINYVRNNDYLSFFKMQMAERHLFNYPPYCRLVKISLKHKSKDFAEKAAEKLAEILRENTDFAVLGPDNPPIEKVQFMFIRDILLKISNKISYKKINEDIFNSIKNLRQIPDYKYILVSVIVDAL
jgi:primosomal protein N' (replication factor Y)